jgi:hypothetical protein
MNPFSVPRGDIAQLLKQRNRFGAMAVGVLIGTVSVCLPRFVAKHRELQRLNTELVALQRTIFVNLDKTRETQAELIAAQRAITAALNAPRVPSQ